MMVVIKGWCGSALLFGILLMAVGCDQSGDAAHPGQKTYDRYCFACHTPGLSGAPKLGDTDAWAPRIAKGQEQLLATTIEGVAPSMPPRGACPTCSDEQLAQAVDYIVQKSQ